MTEQVSFEDIKQLFRETDRKMQETDRKLERLAKLKRAFPRYSGHRVLGAVAAMVIPEEVARYAEKHGLFVIGQAGDDAVLLNSQGFQPRAW